MMSPVESEIPEHVHAWLSEAQFLMETASISRAEQIRYIGLFLYILVRENAHCIADKALTRMLGAIHNCHSKSRQGKKE